MDSRNLGDNKDPCLLESTKSASLEVLLPAELLESLFDISKALNYETPEEKVYREQKEEYNNAIFLKIKDLNFTEKQKYVMNALFFRDLTMAQCAAEMGVAIGTVQVIKRQMITKIKKRVKYNFILKDE